MRRPHHLCSLLQLRVAAPVGHARRPDELSVLLQARIHPFPGDRARAPVRQTKEARMSALREGVRQPEHPEVPVAHHRRPFRKPGRHVQRERLLARRVLAVHRSPGGAKRKARREVVRHHHPEHREVGLAVLVPARRVGPAKRLAPVGRERGAVQQERAGALGSRGRRARELDERAVRHRLRHSHGKRGARVVVAPAPRREPPRKGPLAPRREAPRQLRRHREPSPLHARAFQTLADHEPARQAVGEEAAPSAQA